MSKVTRITSLVAISTMLIGIGESSSTAFADTKASITYDQTTKLKTQQNTVATTPVTKNMIGVQTMAIPALPGYVSDILAIIQGFKYDYSGGVKCGKYMKKAHPKANKYIRAHINLLNMIMSGAAFTVFKNGYLKGSK